jgi:hypothetical protein
VRDVADEARTSPSIYGRCELALSQACDAINLWARLPQGLVLFSRLTKGAKLVLRWSVAKVLQPYEADNLF